MKKIANILYKNGSELPDHKKFDWISYSRCLENGITDKAIDPHIPTLYIGWDLFKIIFVRNNPNILQKKLIRPNHPPITWEFSKEEKMTDHFNGIDQFVKNAPREFCDTYQYISIDPIKNGLENEEEILKLINFDSSYSYHYKNEIIYILNKRNRVIYGIYLNSFNYFKYDINKISSLIKSRVLVAFLDPKGETYQQYYKQFPEFDQLKRIMVLFLS